MRGSPFLSANQAKCELFVNISFLCPIFTYKMRLYMKREYKDGDTDVLLALTFVSA